MQDLSILWGLIVVALSASTVLAVCLAVIWRQLRVTQDISDLRARNNEAVHNAILRDSTKLWRVLGDIEDHARETAGKDA